MVRKTSPEAQSAPSSHSDRRKHRRVDTPLKARFLDQYGDEHPCLVTNISAGGALMKAKSPPEFGAHVVLYIDKLGRFEGRVIRSGEKIFAINYEQRRSRNAKTADGLTEIVNRGSRSHDRRTNPRIRHDAPARVFFEDGRTEDCAILDISLTGASLQISPRPPLGTRLILGRMNAKVVRRHEKGVGIVFTGSAERMADVIQETTSAPETPPVPTNDGVGVARTFGKKVK